MLPGTYNRYLGNIKHVLCCLSAAFHNIKTPVITWCDVPGNIKHPLPGTTDKHLKYDPLVPIRAYVILYITTLHWNSG